MSKKRDAKSSKRASRTDTVRSAVDQAFQATAQATADAGLLTRGRATEIADELVGNITRLRDALEDARPASTEDLKALRVDMAALAERLDRLEGARAYGAVTGDPAPAAKPAARSASPRRGAAKPSAAKPSARASASRSAAAKRTSAAAAAAKPTSAKPRTASKPKPAAKPAAARPAAAKPAASKPRASSPTRAGASGTRSSRKSSASATKT